MIEHDTTSAALKQLGRRSAVVLFAHSACAIYMVRAGELHLLGCDASVHTPGGVVLTFGSPDFLLEPKVKLQLRKAALW